MTDGLEEALSLERIGRYIIWAGGARDRAFDLYALNTRLSESLYVPLQMLEIALRNRIHAVLSKTAGPCWFQLPGFLVGSYQNDQVSSAINDLERTLKPATPGQIVASLTFSFWTTMLGRHYEDLWQATLYRIARREGSKGLQRKDLAGPLTAIRLLRNRIAHHEPILAWDLYKHHTAMVQLTEWLSPAAAVWCRSLDRFPEIFPKEPIVLLDDTAGQNDEC